MELHKLLSQIVLTVIRLFHTCIVLVHILIKSERYIHGCFPFKPDGRSRIAQLSEGFYSFK